MTYFNGNFTDEFNNIINSTINTTLQNDEIQETSLLNILVLSIVLSLIDIVTLIGNLLVVIAVLTTRSLSTVTNYFIMSLAVADMLVAVFVLPISIYMVIYKQVWIFGSIICDFWVSCDVLLCTASILNLCCISLDRYFAITRPLQYSRKRSPKLARFMIAIVWVASLLISLPPIIGWRDPERHKTPNTCSLNRLLSYRIYSSMGSFFIPALVMVFVYARIFKVIHDRENGILNSSSKLYIRASRGGAKLTQNVTTLNISNTNHVNKRLFKYKHPATSVNNGRPYSCNTNSNNRNENVNIKNAETIYEIDNELASSTDDNEVVGVRRKEIPKLYLNFHNKSNDIDDSESICSQFNKPRQLSAYAKISSYLKCLKRKSNPPVKTEIKFNNMISTSFYEINGSKNLNLRNMKQQQLGKINVNTSNLTGQTKMLANSMPLNFHKDYPLTSAIIAKRMINHQNNNTNQKANNKNSVLEFTSSDSNFQRSKPRFGQYKVPHTPNSTNRYQEHIRLIKESKAAKTLGIVVGGFIVCWLPFFIYYVLESICPLCISPTVFDSLTWLGYFNSVINPFIYAFYSKQFRFAFYRLTLGKCR